MFPGLIFILMVVRNDFVNGLSFFDDFAHNCASFLFILLFPSSFKSKI